MGGGDGELPGGHIGGGDGEVLCCIRAGGGQIDGDEEIPGSTAVDCAMGISELYCRPPTGYGPARGDGEVLCGGADCV